MYQFYNRHETGHKLKTYFGPVLNLSAQIGTLGDQKDHGPNIKKHYSLSSLTVHFKRSGI